MGIHQIFAQNLRKQCEQFESIAEACKQIEVNRQQFNKYLSGAILPNARTLKRICRACKIEDWELFVPTNSKYSDEVNAVAAQTSSRKSKHSTEAWTSLIDTIVKFNVEPRIDVGFYSCYFPLPGFRGFAVRSTLLISKSEGCFRFVRHTRINSPFSPKSTLAHGKHRGTIMSNGTMDYLFGVNSLAPMNISFLALPREGRELKVGLAIIHGVSQHFACKVVFESLGHSLRKTERFNPRQSIIATDSPGLNPLVAQIMNNAFDDVPGQLTLPNVEKLLFNNIS
jgi:transcriptional regulator with XRE-family HTH domain